MTFTNRATGSVIATSAPLSPSTSCVAETVTLEQGHVYVATVEATRVGGSVTSASSDGMFVDSQPPLAGNLTWGPACDNMQFVTTIPESLQLCWHGFADMDRYNRGDHGWKEGMR